MTSPNKKDPCKAYVSGRVLVRKQDGFAFDRKDIYTRGGLISEDIPIQDCEVIDCSGKILFSAFFNMHVHLGENMFRDISGGDWTIRDYLNYTNRIQEQMSDRERTLSWECSANEVIRSLRQNYTAGFCAGRAVCSLPIGDFAVMSAYPLMKGKKLEHFMKSGIDGFLNYRRQNATANCNIGIILHSLYMNDGDSLLFAKQCLKNGAAFLVIHVAEDEFTSSLETAKYGMSGIRFLDRCGLLSENTILVHCGCASPDDLKLVSAHGSAIAICPVSNRFLNTAPPDISFLDQCGIPWFLCTDGTATGRTLSMFDQAAELKKLHPALQYSEIYESITCRPAKVYKNRFYTGELTPMSTACFLVSDDLNEPPEKFLESVFLRNNRCTLIM